ncbi:hypothetical protein A5695_26685 [Mycobacterium sp. E1747]|nr:hypothetical protein A5695_26685 [Mycobacterium sp. E1747]
MKERAMSIIEDFRKTPAVPYEDLTVAEAWASSPLGDPALEDGSLSRSVTPESPATTVTAKPRQRGTNVLVAGALVAALGAVAGLGLVLIERSGAKEPRPTVVVPNSSVGSVTPQAPSAVEPPPVAPAPATAPDAGHVSPGPMSGGDAPVVIVPAPPAPAPAAPAPAYPGTPPPPPHVTVNAPPVIVPVPVPVWVPPKQGGSQQGGGQQGGGQPAPSGHGPIQCYACHPPQPVHPQPIHPQPLHP